MLGFGGVACRKDGSGTLETTAGVDGPNSPARVARQDPMQQLDFRYIHRIEHFATNGTHCLRLTATIANPNGPIEMRSGTLRVRVRQMEPAPEVEFEMGTVTLGPHPITIPATPKDNRPDRVQLIVTLPVAPKERADCLADALNVFMNPTSRFVLFIYSGEETGVPIKTAGSVTPIRFTLKFEPRNRGNMGEILFY